MKKKIILVVVVVLIVVLGSTIYFLKHQNPQEVEQTVSAQEQKPDLTAAELLQEQRLDFTEAELDRMQAEMDRENAVIEQAHLRIERARSWNEILNNSDEK